MENGNWYEPYISCWGDEEPSQFAATFARTLPIEAGKTRFLDIGCGSGIIGIYSLMAKQVRAVTFMDKEPAWLEIARKNVDIKINESKIAASQVRFLPPSDFTAIPYELVTQHDLCGFNGPQLPYAYIDAETQQKIDSDPIERSFRRGGETGLEVIGKFLAWYASLPMPKPDAVILLSSFLGRKRIDETILAAGLKPRELPIETDATLRKMFWKQADVFSNSPAEVEDRSIRKVGGIWHKKLLSYRLTDLRA